MNYLVHSMKRTLTIIAITLTFCSCVTIYNGDHTELKIATEKNCRVIVDDDTFPGAQNNAVSVLRQREPLQVTIFNDSVKKTVFIKSRNSSSYIADWLYVPLIVGIAGVLVDRKKPKRYTYPKHIFIGLDTAGADYLPYIPNENPLKNTLKLTPLRLLLSHPGVELSYERFHGKQFSTQLSLAALYNMAWDEGPSSGSGYQVSLEEKYFFRKNNRGIYSSFETGYLNMINSYDVEYINLKTSKVYEGTKKMIYFTPKLGTQIEFKNNFMIDAYFGLGVKYEERRFANIENPDDFYTSIFWQAKVPLNVKIGFRF
jgi:hypothetical protein